MALHDPESTEQEKAIALKIGRQKKIQIIDGQQVEVLTGDDEDDEEEPEDYEDSDELLEPSDTEEGAPVGTGVEQKMMAVEGQDGQQYVVLEVIQLPENSAAGGATVKVEAGQQAQSPVKAVKEGQSGPPAAKKARVDSEKKQADLASAFGFDDDDEEDEWKNLRLKSGAFNKTQFKKSFTL